MSEIVATPGKLREPYMKFHAISISLHRAPSPCPRIIASSGQLGSLAMDAESNPTKSNPEQPDAGSVDPALIDLAAALVDGARNIVVLTGAGISSFALAVPG